MLFIEKGHIYRFRCYETFRVLLVSNSVEHARKLKDIRDPNNLHTCTSFVIKLLPREGGGGRFQSIFIQIKCNESLKTMTFNVSVSTLVPRSLKSTDGVRGMRDTEARSLFAIFVRCI